MTARVRLLAMSGAFALVAVPVLAQHHDEPAKRPSKAVHHDEPAAAGHAEPVKRPSKTPRGEDASGHAAKGASLGLVAPAAPTVAPAGHGRAKASERTSGEKSHEEPAAPASAGARRKVDVLKQTSSPGAVAASINQRLAELAELRRTAPVGLPRRQAAKREATLSEVVQVVAPAVKEAPEAEPARPVVKLQWRVPVSWPDEMSEQAHEHRMTSAVTSSAAVP